MLNVLLHVDSNLNAESNETIVFIEGIGANLKGWDLFTQPFAARCNVVRYDHPCAGRSFLHSGRALSDNDFIESLEHLLSPMKGRIHLVGYSLGGGIIFRWLCNRSSINYGKIKSVTIAAGFANMYDDLVAGLKMTRDVLSTEDAKSSHIKSLPFLYDAESLKNRSFYDYLVNRCRDDKDFISSRDFILQIDACLSSNEWRALPPVRDCFQMPLLLMYAEDDKIVDPHHTLLLKEYFSDATVHAFPHGGHCFKDVHREKFIQLIQDHISSLPHPPPCQRADGDGEGEPPQKRCD